MYAAHSTRALDKNIGALTGVPRCLEQIVDPAAELQVCEQIKSGSGGLILPSEHPPLGMRL